jgi:glycerol-3-phosphate dehydrogenase
VNYVIDVSRASPRLVNVAAIRSTGLTASLGIAERVAEIVGRLGISLRPERDLMPGPRPVIDGPWWRRAADYRSLA